jgi:hypothetical protein
MLPTTLASLAVLTSLGSTPAPASAASSAGRTTVEKGYVIECTGKLAGRPVNASLYENNAYKNVVGLSIGDAGGSAEPGDVVRGSKVRTSVRVDGATAKIAGTVRTTGRPTPVREDLEDNEQHIVSVGTHRKVKTRLTLSYKGTSARLTCANAFRYKLRVTKTPVS